MKKYINSYDTISEENEQKALSDYYKNYIKASPVDPSIFAPGSAIVHKPTALGPSTTANCITTGSSTTATNGLFTSPICTTSMGDSWDNWTKEEKKVLAKVGFKYNKKKESWELDLSTTVLVPQLEGIMAWPAENHEKPSDMAIKIMKQLKKQLIERLTAKIILMELIKSHEIKE